MDRYKSRGLSLCKCNAVQMCCHPNAMSRIDLTPQGHISSTSPSPSTFSFFTFPFDFNVSS